jgi:hypothetical protein
LYRQPLQEEQKHQRLLLRLEGTTTVMFSCELAVLQDYILEERIQRTNVILACCLVVPDVCK